MTAAVRLCDAGQSVRVFEANHFLGGRTASWNERGMEIESGFHRFLGFYTALPEILEKVGLVLDDILSWEDEIEIRIPNEMNEVLGLAPLHKPLKTAWNLFGHNDFLPPVDKAALAAMFAAGAKEYLASPTALDQKTVGEYARAHNVSEQTIYRLLTPLTEGIFFVSVEKYSMHNLMGLFMPYLKTLPKLRVGAFMGGMSRVMMQPMANYVLARRGVITTHCPVERLIIENDSVVGVKTSSGEVRAQHVILAASLHGAQSIIRQSFSDDSAFKKIMALETMPSVTFQIELTEPGMEFDRTTFGPGTVMASFTEQSRTTFRGSPGRLSVILSPPEEFIAMPEAEIIKRVVQDAKRLGVRLEGKIKEYRKVVLRHDFYSLTPGNEQLRPSQKTGIPGLLLAGDYTKQPYLATMEGAVVSGNRATELVLG